MSRGFGPVLSAGRPGENPPGGSFRSSARGVPALRQGTGFRIGPQMC